MMRVRPLPLDPRRVTLLTMLTICGCSGCKPTEQAAAPVVIEGRPTGLMFDASGSMSAALDGTPKTEVGHDSLACLATETGGTVTAVNDTPSLAMALDDDVSPQREPPPGERGERGNAGQTRLVELNSFYLIEGPSQESPAPRFHALVNPRERRARPRPARRERQLAVPDRIQRGLETLVRESGKAVHRVHFSLQPHNIEIESMVTLGPAARKEGIRRLQAQKEARYQGVVTHLERQGCSKIRVMTLGTSIYADCDLSGQVTRLVRHPDILFVGLLVRDATPHDEELPPLDDMLSPW